MQKELLAKIQALMKRAERFRWHIAAGAVLLVLISAALFWLAVSGRIRSGGTATPSTQSTSTEPMARMVPRRLDGVLVPLGQQALPPRAVMIENHPDARPVSGLAKASVVIEAPVEGGITRFMALYDATTTVEEVGPVRSARPYFVEWADSLNASYFHVGGSPDALDLIKTLAGFTDVNEFAYSTTFWRDNRRAAPHNVYTKKELMDLITGRKVASSTQSIAAWHFQNAVSSTERGDTPAFKITYGGSFNVSWSYDKERGVYVRRQANQLQKDRDGSAIESENVIVMKTEQQVLDSVGRLKVRTTGNGEAVGYRDGKKYVLRWRRSAGEPLRFETADGGEFVLTRGRTWIQVTTDDTSFAGFGG